MRHRDDPADPAHVDLEPAARDLVLVAANGPESEVERQHDLRALDGRRTPSLPSTSRPVLAISSRMHPSGVIGFLAVVGGGVPTNAAPGRTSAPISGTEASAAAISPVRPTTWRLLRPAASPAWPSIGETIAPLTRSARASSASVASTTSMPTVVPIESLSASAFCSTEVEPSQSSSTVAAASSKCVRGTRDLVGHDELSAVPDRFHARSGCPSGRSGPRAQLTRTSDRQRATRPALARALPRPRGATRARTAGTSSTRRAASSTPVPAPSGSPLHRETAQRRG